MLGLAVPPGFFSGIDELLARVDFELINYGFTVDYFSS